MWNIFYFLSDMTDTILLVRRERKMKIPLHVQISVFLNSKYLFCQSTFFLSIAWTWLRFKWGPALLMLSIYFFCLVYFNTDHWLFIVNGIMAVIGVIFHFSLKKTRQRVGSRFTFERNTTLATSFHASFDDFTPVVH